MQRDFWSLVLACGFGALVGVFVSLEITEHFQYGRYFWGIGAVLGGLVGYVSVDFSDFREGLILAYRRTIAWRPDGLYWKTFFLTFFEYMVLCLNSVVFFYVVFGDHFLLILGLVLIFSACLSFLYASDIMSPDRYSDLYWPTQGLWWLMRRAPSAVAAAPSALAEGTLTLGRFAATVFRYVHSRRRTICFSCAALGAAAGYYAGSALAGAVIGAMLGAVEYQLVALRWLKLVPNGGRA
ncbi:MAG: hypothetical protein HYV66_01730 [Candidatus Sungbacteria bacterium]|uniref:Uncharacterized protein n=1 Tax=Candidatus Sungiibacteriota bacterium TaxID=2750080 RepID=A0A932DSC8_9BACT|nr:hypothetical protein [Candidatus Sungbacteria bacterium]